MADVSFDDLIPAKDTTAPSKGADISFDGICHRKHRHTFHRPRWNNLKRKELDRNTKTIWRVMVYSIFNANREFK